MRASTDGRYADRFLPVLLSLCQLRNRSSAQRGRLLRVLLLWVRTLPPGTASTAKIRRLDTWYEKGHLHSAGAFLCVQKYVWIRRKWSGLVRLDKPLRGANGPIWHTWRNPNGAEKVRFRPVRVYLLCTFCAPCSELERPLQEPHDAACQGHHDEYPSGSVPPLYWLDG